MHTTFKKKYSNLRMVLNPHNARYAAKWPFSMHHSNSLFTLYQKKDTIV